MSVRILKPDTLKNETLHGCFSPEAENELVALYEYISLAASPETAFAYTNALLSACEKLNTFPIRGIARDDIRPGLRITNYKKRMIIAFGVDEEAKTLSILGFFYGGQDYEALLRNEAED